MVVELNDRLCVPYGNFSAGMKISAGLKKELEVPAVPAFLD